MSDYQDNWIYKLIPEKEYNLVLDLANNKAVSDALKYPVEMMNLN